MWCLRNKNKPPRRRRSIANERTDTKRTARAAAPPAAGVEKATVVPPHEHPKTKERQFPANRIVKRHATIPPFSPWKPKTRVLAGDKWRGKRRPLQNRACATGANAFFIDYSKNPRRFVGGGNEQPSFSPSIVSLRHENTGAICFQNIVA